MKNLKAVISSTLLMICIYPPSSLSHPRIDSTYNPSAQLIGGCATFGIGRFPNSNGAVVYGGSVFYASGSEIATLRCLYRKEQRSDFTGFQRSDQGSIPSSDWGHLLQIDLLAGLRVDTFLGMSELYGGFCYLKGTYDSDVKFNKIPVPGWPGTYQMVGYYDKVAVSSVGISTGFRQSWLFAHFVGVSVEATADFAGSTIPLTGLVFSIHIGDLE